MKECTLDEQKLGEKRAGDEQVEEGGGKEKFPLFPSPCSQFHYLCMLFWKAREIQQAKSYTLVVLFEANIYRYVYMDGNYGHNKMQEILLLTFYNYVKYDISDN